MEDKELIEGEKQDHIQKEVDEKGERVTEKGDEAKKGSKHGAGSLEYLVDVTVAYPKGKPILLTQPQAQSVNFHSDISRCSHFRTKRSLILLFGKFEGFLHSQENRWTFKALSPVGGNPVSPTSTIGFFLSGDFLVFLVDLLCFVSIIFSTL